MSNTTENLETTREMKDSGIKWIGEIPKEWSVVKYKTFSHNAKGETIIKTDVTNNGIPIYSASKNGEVFGYIKSAKKILNYGDLVISARGTIGTTYFITDEIATCTQNTICSKMKDVNKRFIYYCSCGLKEYWFEFTQTAVPQLTVEQVKNNLVPLPPLHEQQAIAKYLDEKVGKIDELIAEQNKAIKNWKSYKQSLITEKVTKGLNPNAKMKDSGIEWIGEIPVSWEVFKLKNKYKFHTGFTPDSKNEDYYDDCGHIWITISDLTNSKYISNSSKKISQVGLNNSKGILTPKGSLLYSFKLSVGQVAITDKDCYTNEAIASFPVKENPCIEFLYYSSQICIAKNNNENIYGSKILNQELINNAWIIFPTLNEQQAIANYLDETVEKIDELIKQKQVFIKQLEEYKQSLIYECVTGKIEVRER